MKLKRLIESAAFFILLVVIALRPLVSESYDSIGNPMTTALQAVTDPSPVRTLGFDLAILVAALAWLVARALRTSHPYRKTGLEWGVCLLVVAGAVSCAFAGQKRLALTATIDWLCYPLLCMVLVQLLRRSWERRVLLGVVIATGCVQAVQCLDEHFIRFDDNWSYYLTIKDDFWARQGVELDSSRVELFERRILAREASGFLPHSNLTGSYLTLCGFVAFGLCGSLRRRRAADAPDERGDRKRTDVAAGDAARVLVRAARWVVVAGMAVAVWTTQSLGAWITALLGLTVAAMVYPARGWIHAHRRRALLIGWLIAAAGLGSLLGFGLYFDRLPHMSLTFRWQYWKASMPLIADHALTGVGRENFGRHYLQYKSIDSPEEVANPHNVFVQAAADWGVLGFGGMLVMVIGVSVVLTRRPRQDESADDGVRDIHPRVGLAWGASVLVALSLCRLFLLDAVDAEYFSLAYYATIVTAMVWGFVFLVFSPDGRGKTDGLQGMWPAIAVLTFVIHEIINFALFSPACATTFAAVLAVAIAEKAPAESAQRAQTAKQAWFAPCLAGAGLLVLLVWQVRPVMNSASHLAAAKGLQNQVAQGGIVDQPAYAHFQRAVDTDRLDSGALLAQAEWLVRLLQVPPHRDEAISLAIRSLEEARRRDPFFVRLPRLLSDLYLARAMSSGSADAYGAGVTAAREALALYPRDPAGLVTLADRLARAGEALHERASLEEARATYESALALDDARPAWERIRGLRPREREAMRARIREIERQLE